MAHTSTYRTLLGDVPYPCHVSIVDGFDRRAHRLRDQADTWEAMGFHNNASYWRKEAREAELDKYRLSVILGICEEDEDLEEEIDGLVAKREGTTIAR